MAVGCFIFSLVLFLLAGFYWLAAHRMVKHARRTVRRLKATLKVSKGKRDARRMRLRELQEKEVGQRSSPLNRYRPAAPYAKAQGFGQRRKKGLIKIYGGK